MMPCVRTLLNPDVPGAMFDRPHHLHLHRSREVADVAGKVAHRSTDGWAPPGALLSRRLHRRRHFRGRGRVRNATGRTDRGGDEREERSVAISRIEDAPAILDADRPERRLIFRAFRME